MDKTLSFAILFILLITSFFLWIIIGSVRIDREQKVEKKQNTIECVQKGNDIEWCLKVIKQ